MRGSHRHLIECGYHESEFARFTDQQERHIPPRFRDADTDRALPDAGLYISGPVGVGKTYLAAALARRAIREEGCTVEWVTVSSWLAAMRASFNGGPAAVTPDELAHADLLVLDDVGAEKATDWSTESLFSVVNLAYERATPLIVTSNMPPSELGKKHGPRIVSRLVEMCELLPLSGEDRRLAAARARREVAR